MLVHADLGLVIWAYEKMSDNKDKEKLERLSLGFSFSFSHLFFSGEIFRPSDKDLLI